MSIGQVDHGLANFGAGLMGPPQTVDNVDEHDEELEANAAEHDAVKCAGEGQGGPQERENDSTHRPPVSTPFAFFDEAAMPPPTA